MVEHPLLATCSQHEWVWIGFCGADRGVRTRLGLYLQAAAEGRPAGSAHLEWPPQAHSPSHAVAAAAQPACSC